MRTLAVVSCLALACGRSELEVFDTTLAAARGGATNVGGGGATNVGGGGATNIGGGGATNVGGGGATNVGCGGARACTWGLGQPVTYPGGVAPSTVAVADLDGDGDNDIAVNNYGGGRDGLRIQLLANRGDGTFESGASFLSTVAFSMAVGPFVSSKNDLLVSCELFTNQGDGTFGPPLTYGTTCGDQNSWRNLATGDFDADGKLDVAWGIWNDALAYLNRGDGVFSEVDTALSPQALHVTSMASADFDRDGFTDLATASWGYGNPNFIAVLHSRGDGSFDVATLPTDRTAPNSIAAGDVNGDGRPDLVTTGSALGVDVRLQASDGSFRAPASYAASLVNPITLLGDVNGDGATDIVIANESAFTISVLFNTGAGTFGNATSLATAGMVWNATLGDVNADGHLDLVAALTASQPGGYVEVWLSECRR